MVNKLSNIKERILHLADIKDFNAKEFIVQIGMSESSFKGAAKQTPINSNAVGEVLKLIPDANMKWVLMGEGEPILPDAKELPVVKELQSFYLKTDKGIDQQIIPLYNLEATAGLVSLFTDHNDIEPIDTIRIPNLPKCDGAVFVAGDSMYPLLKSGDIVIYKKIQDFQNDIFWGQMYLVSVTVNEEEYVMVKYVQKSDKGEEYITLVSENRHHQDKVIHMNKIRAMALIKGSVRINTMS